MIYEIVVYGESVPTHWGPARPIKFRRYCEAEDMGTALGIAMMDLDLDENDETVTVTKLSEAQAKEIRDAEEEIPPF